MVYTDYVQSIGRVKVVVAEAVVPKLRYFLVDGQGDPNNSESFEEAVQLLYGASYTVRMSYKSGWAIPGYETYKVGPLDGFWWVEGNTMYSADLSREAWRWTLGIAQPDFVTESVYASTVDVLRKKKPGLDVSRLHTEEIEEGQVMQVLHLGPYADEPATLKKMDEYREEKGLAFRGKHHEIYLGDPRKGDPAKLRTILRHPVE